MNQTSYEALLTATLQRETIRALTLTQPWATLVAIGAKHYETRSWGTSHVGPIAIHAAKGYPEEAEELCDDEPFRSPLDEAGYHWHPDRQRNVRGLPTGAIIAVAWLAQVERITPDFPVTRTERTFGNYAPGRYAWRFSVVYRLSQPIPARGTLGLWTWHPLPNLLEEVQHELDHLKFSRTVLGENLHICAQKYDTPGHDQDVVGRLEQEKTSAHFDHLPR